MAADTAELAKVDSAVSGIAGSPTSEKKMSHRRTSSSVSGVFNVKDLETEKTDIAIAPETQKLNWKVNQSPSQVDDPAVLKKLLCEPPIKRIDLKFKLGLEVTARNMKGVTIKDALDAIHKPFKKKADDELELPYLKGFEWDKEEDWCSFIVHLSKVGEPQNMGGGSSKKNKKKSGDD